MKHAILLLTIFSLGVLNLYSQTDFRSGYIIKNNNDTLYGLIDFRGNVANTKKCIYKKEVNSEKQEFYPSELMAYRFTDGKYYVTRTIKSGETKDQLFLEYLINGLVDVYYYCDLNGDHYMVDKGDGILLELKNELKEVVVNDTKYYKDSKEYIGILKYIFRESPSVSKKVESISLNSKSLINITKDFQKERCSNEECMVYEKKMPKMKVSFGFGPLIGLNRIDISINKLPDGYSYLENSHFETIISPSVGLFCNVGIPNFSKNFRLEYAGSFSKWNTSTHNSKIEPINYMTVKEDIFLKQIVFNNALHLKYEYVKGKFRPTLKLGFFNNLFINADYTRNTDVKWSHGETYLTEVSHKNPFSNNEYGISFGAGLIDKCSNYDLFLDFNYQRGAGLLSNVNIKDQNTNCFSLSLGIQFGK